MSFPGDVSEKGYPYSLEGLRLDWDNTPEVRALLRDGRKVFRHFDEETQTPSDGEVQRTVANVRHNLCALRPLLRRCAENDLKIPLIDSIIEEIRLLYKCSKITSLYSAFYQEGWAARRLLALGKNTVQHRKWLLEDQHVPNTNPKINFILYYIYFMLLKSFAGNMFYER